MFGYALALFRLLALTFVSLFFLIITLVMYPFGNHSMPYILRIRRIWDRIGIWILGVRIIGNLPPNMESPFLMVGNHRSYIDPLVVLDQALVMPVAKAEVSS